MTDSSDGDSDVARARQRLRSLMIHFAGYFAVIAVLAAANLSLDPGNLWFVWPMVGWGGVLAIHTAWAMGLFDILGDSR